VADDIAERMRELARQRDAYKAQLEAACLLFVRVARNLETALITPEGCPFHDRWRERARDPKPGDLVVEVSRFRVSSDLVGVLVEHIPGKDPATPFDAGTPESWTVRELVSGEVHTWGNARFVGLERPKA
jgi:hypothetical protein